MAKSSKMHKNGGKSRKNCLKFEKIMQSILNIEQNVIIQGGIRN